MSLESKRNLVSEAKVLVFKDSNGGLQIHPETYKYFVPNFKLTNALRKLEAVKVKIEETQEAIKIFLDTQESGT